MLPFRYDHQPLVLIDKEPYVVAVISLAPTPIVKLHGQASRPISTTRLNVLPRLHLWPINLVISEGPSGPYGRDSCFLGIGFPLRCFQRLSVPDIDTRHCRWRDNRHTRGPSTLVLSY